VTYIPAIEGDIQLHGRNIGIYSIRGVYLIVMAKDKRVVNTGEVGISSQRSVKSFEHTLSRFLKVVPFVLIIGLVPNIAHAHSGLEGHMRYAMLGGLLAGVITGAVCAIWHLSVRDVFNPSFGIYLIVFMIGGFVPVLFEEQLGLGLLLFSLFVLGIIGAAAGCYPSCWGLLRCHL
jgi:hypothetical protein